MQAGDFVRLGGQATADYTGCGLALPTAQAQCQPKIGAADADVQAGVVYVGQLDGTLGNQKRE